MRAWLRKWWPWIKRLLAVALLVAIGRHFFRDLRQVDLRDHPLHWEWLLVSGLLYLLGLGCSALFWYRLLRALGQRPAVPAVIRAYYLGHLGKYLPGKAWALFLRAGLVTRGGVPMGLAAWTSLYEVLTTMAGGVLLAALVLPWQLPDSPPEGGLPILRYLLSPDASELPTADRRGVLLLIAVLLLAVGVPIIPPVFNRLVRGTTQRFANAEAQHMPHLRPIVPCEGLLLTAGGWLLLGASLWAVLHAILARPPDWSWALWTRYSGYLALAYVAGFVILIVPSGLGVREFFLTLFLIHDPDIVPLLNVGDAETKATVLLVVLLLRLIWTGAEGIMTSIVYWLPTTAPAAALGPQPPTALGAGLPTPPPPPTTDSGPRPTDA